MSAQIDCPICMDVIEINKNCVTTECGHCFHASCLMTSVAHNGFGCPYCRTEMAKEPEQEEEDWETDDGEEEEEEEIFDENALRGFRFFWNNLNGDEHEQEDNDDENAAEEEEDEEEQEDDENVPSTDFVAQKLREQGVTFEQLVHMMCNLDHDEYRNTEQAERFGDELFGKIRIIVSNYTPDQAASSTQTPAESLSSPVTAPVSAPVSAPVEAPVNVDFDAQPKIYSRRMMIHV
jgi:hypothetical protein